MDELSFEGRVAIVTGAGRGIGRAHALLLAERGARVVVNDLGGSMGGDGRDATPAQQVVDEIVDDGGEAMADSHDVSSEAGAVALVGSALDRWGHLDVLVNNAGIIRWAAMPGVDEDNLRRHLDVHVGGSFHTTRAAWPTMVDQGYGRIVMTTSSGIFGLPANLSYATAKAGVIGMTRSLALVGAKHGIRINLIAPAAYTRMAGDAGADGDDADPMAAAMASELVAPMVAALAHETCPVTGEIYTAGAGRFARVVLATTDGWVAGDGTPTPEDVVAHWDEIHDVTEPWVPRDLMDWSQRFLSHLD